MNVIVALSLLFGLSACSLKKSADEMRRDLARVRQQTGQLAGRGEDATNDLGYAASFQVAVLGNLDRIFGENESFWSGWLGARSKDPDILLYATSAIDAMWFQTWRGHASDDLVALDRRLRVGLELLLTIAYKHAPADGDVTTRWPNRSLKGLAALAVNLHRTRPEFEQAWTKTGLPGDVSLYHVMLDALARRNDVDLGTRFPGAVDMVLRRPQTATYLLQLRHNYLPVLAMALMTGLARVNTVGQGLHAVTGPSISLDHATIAEVNEWSGMLADARATRAALANIGIPPAYNYVLNKMARSVRYELGWYIKAHLSDSDPLNVRRVAFAREYLDTLPKVARRFRF